MRIDEIKRAMPDMLGTLGIGKSEFLRLVRDWMNHRSIYDYTISDDGTINVYDEVKIGGVEMEALPPYINFGEANNVFSVMHCGIKSLRGFPHTVKGIFNCSNNEMTDLIGGPGRVYGDYVCHSCRLTTLRGGPEWVKHSFNCSDNVLTSLVGGPSYVGASYWANGNRLADLRGLPGKITGRLSVSGNPLKSLDDLTDVRTVDAKDVDVSPDYMWERYGMYTVNGVTYVRNED